MSILTGLLKCRGDVVFASQLRQKCRLTERYATGAEVVYASGRVGMCVQPYATHRRFELENGPRWDAFGNVLSFDGRLDNFHDIAASLNLESDATSDSAITLAAFQRWGDSCFSRLTGDWALALWCEQEQSLYLSRDHAGTRTLFYRSDSREAAWGTYLESVIGDEHSPRLAEEYLASALASQQLRELTPYEGIRSVLPGHTVRLQRGLVTQHRHWFPFDKGELRYRSDAEYDDRFLALLRQAVSRRSQESDPVMAELSGGMDSTAIVCVSDQLRRRNSAKELLETVSYYDDSEASLDERTYFSITEAKRGKPGAHLDTAYAQRTLLPHDATQGTYMVPGADSVSILREQQLKELLWDRGYRALLSGIGGDELLGGVPDSNPELSGYLISGRWGRLIGQSVAWSLVDRTPLVQTLSKVIRFTGRIYLDAGPRRPITPWLSKPLQEAAVERSRALSKAVRRFGREPRQIDNERTWWSILESAPHNFPRLLVRPEYRYPYLDKDLAEYLVRVPRTQLLKPGRRRLLMRRALKGIVPEEILERKRKAFQLRAPLLKVQQSQDHLRQLFANSLLVQMGCINREVFLRAVQSTSGGNMTYWFALMQTIAVELWLQSRCVLPDTHKADVVLSSAADPAASEFRFQTQIVA